MQARLFINILNLFADTTADRTIFKSSPKTPKMPDYSTAESDKIMTRSGLTPNSSQDSGNWNEHYAGLHNSSVHTNDISTENFTQHKIRILSFAARDGEGHQGRSEMTKRQSLDSPDSRKTTLPTTILTPGFHNGRDCERMKARNWTCTQQWIQKTKKATSTLPTAVNTVFDNSNSYTGQHHGITTSTSYWKLDSSTQRKTAMHAPARSKRFFFIPSWEDNSGGRTTDHTVGFPTTLTSRSFGGKKYLDQRNTVPQSWTEYKTAKQMMTLQSGKTTKQTVALQSALPSSWENNSGGWNTYWAERTTLKNIPSQTQYKTTMQMKTLQSGKTTKQTVALQSGKTTTQMVTPTNRESVKLPRIRMAILPLKNPVTNVTFHYYDNNENIKEEYLNAFKQEYSIQENETTAFPHSNIEKKIELARQAFNDIPIKSSYGEPTRVAIMVVLPSTYTNEIAEKVKSIQNHLSEDQPLNFHLFIIMVGFDNHPQVLRIRNTISVNSLSEQNYQAISMAICLQCKPGWMTFVQPPGRGHLYSCYHVHKADSLQTWYEASEACKKLDAELASIETEEESDFLSNPGSKLMNIVARNPVEFIYLGIVRDQESLNKRYQWRNKNPMILFSTYFFLHGEGRDCFGWNFQYRYTIFFLFKKFEWRGINCGFPVGDLALCESVHAQLIDETASVFAVNPAHNESFHKALSRGEFTLHYGQIVSLQHGIDDKEFLSMLEKNNSFLLFHCEDNLSSGTRIPYSLVCDNIKHCSNDRDETMCQYRSCTEGDEFRCDSGQCIPSEAVCDAFSDCFDSSDERDCTECKGHLCSNGACFPKHLFYYGPNDCLKASVPLASPSMRALIKTEEFIKNNEKCTLICNRTECVFPLQFNDGVTDCQGPEGPLDETIGKLEREQCGITTHISYTNDIYMWAPYCIYIKDRYNTVIGCWNNAHLYNCKNYKCPEGYVHCPDSYCIPLHYVQDGNNDCPMGEDEQYIENRTCVGNFACSGSRVCLHPDLVCDRQPHCPHGDDEWNCHVTCRQGFRCIAGTVTVTTDYNTNVPLTSLSFVDSRVRYLDLSGVDLSSVKDGNNLINLVDVRLSKCKLTDVNVILAVSPTNLNTVYKIDLSENLIEEVRRYDIFNFMDNLHVLDLSRNKRLTVLTDRVFLPFNKPSVLHTLDLSYTGLPFLHKSVLEGLTRLRILNLTGALITDYRRENFPDKFFLDTLDLRKTPIKHIGTESFKGLTIQLNLYTDDFRLCCPQIRGSGIADYKCHASSNAFSSCTNLINQDIQRILIWLVGTISVLGNIIVLSVRVIFEKDALKKSHSLFIANLSIADLIMGLYLFTIAVADLKYKDVYVIYEEEWRNSITCQTAGFLSTLSSETSAFFILLITLDRFFVIKFPFGQIRFSKKSVILASILAWSLGFLLAFVPLFLTVYSSNGVCLGLPLTTEFNDGWGYSVFVFVGLNFVIFLAIACGQFVIYKAYSTSRAVIKSSNSDVHATRVQDILLAKRLSLVALSDFLCWFPIFIMGVLVLRGYDIGHEWYIWSAVLIIPINSALNPMLYTLPTLYDKLANIWSKRRSTKVLKDRSDNLTEADKSLFRFMKGEPELANLLKILNFSKSCHLQDILEQMALVIEDPSKNAQKPGLTG